jgi:hypothetical protein
MRECVRPIEQAVDPGLVSLLYRTKDRVSRAAQITSGMAALVSACSIGQRSHQHYGKV